MPTTHFYETDFQIGGKKVLVFAEVYVRIPVAPRIMGALPYEGHPADPA